MDEKKNRDSKPPSTSAEKGNKDRTVWSNELKDKMDPWKALVRLEENPTLSASAAATEIAALHASVSSNLTSMALEPTAKKKKSSKVAPLLAQHTRESAAQSVAKTRRKETDEFFSYRTSKPLEVREAAPRGGRWYSKQEFLEYYDSLEEWDESKRIKELKISYHALKDELKERDNEIRNLRKTSSEWEYDFYMASNDSEYYYNKLEKCKEEVNRVLLNYKLTEEAKCYQDWINELSDLLNKEYILEMRDSNNNT
jgi:hypothetical protein